MEAPGTARDHLRNRTADLHHRVEKTLRIRELVAGHLPPEGYLGVLRLHLRVYGRFQHRTRPLRATTRLSEFLETIDTLVAALQQDLGLPNSAGEDQPGNSLSEAAALGGLYVLLGATHGSRVLLPKLQASPSLSSVSNHNFYAAAAAVPPEQWNRLVSKLNAVDTPEQRSLYLKGARNTFSQYIDARELL